MNRFFGRTLLSATLLTAPLSLPAFAETQINALFMAQAAYSEADVRAMTEAFTKANPDIKVNLEFVPYEGLHDKTVLAQGAGNAYDVVLFDVIWPAEFAANNVLVDVTSKITDEMKAGVLPGAWTTVKYDEKFYGMPWILDTKYLFYNKEILEKAGIANPPKTWEELAADAKIIKDKGILASPIAWSWAQAEAAICDYTTLVSAFGGDFPEGRQACLPVGRRSRRAEVHGRQLHLRHHQPELQGVPGGRRPQGVRERRRRVRPQLDLHVQHGQRSEGLEGRRQGRRRAGAGRRRQERGVGRQRPRWDSASPPPASIRTRPGSTSSS